MVWCKSPNTHPAIREPALFHPIHQARRQQLRRLKNQSLISELQAMDAPVSTSPGFRDRCFPPLETLAMFVAQALDADHSCQKAVNDAAVRRIAQGLEPCSTATGAYCRARRRMPLGLAAGLTQWSGRHASRGIPREWHWRGRQVRLVDGTFLSLPDTAANQEVYPQSGNQKPGLGFPLCRLVGLFCLGSGSVLNVAIGKMKGKGGDERSLLRSLLPTLDQGDVLMGDALYGTYFLFSDLLARQVDGVFEQHGARRRTTNFTQGKSLGERDHLIVLEKPKVRPEWMAEEDYLKAPATLTVRELHTGGKLLVTTLLCSRKTPKAALKSLYRERWQVELDFRNLKVTLGLDRLRCRSPEMAEKEVWVYLLAYNLIRQAMVQAAALTQRRPRQLSFKHALQIVQAARVGGLEQGLEIQLALRLLMGQRQIGNRPGRIEPRAVKRRNKPYPLLVKPRSVAREEVRRNGHPKKLK